MRDELGPPKSGDLRPRVLVADDHRGFRTMLEVMLSLDPRLSVVGVAADGAEAVRLAGELCPDVVLMDIAMPVMDGFEATRLIRAAGAARVLMLTGSAANIDLQLAREAGASGYVTKSMLTDLADAILELARQ